MGCMPAMGLPVLLRVSEWHIHCMIKVHIRSVVVHGCGPLQVGLVAVGHGAVSHHLILRIHGVVHHHALVSLLVLQMTEVL